MCSAASSCEAEVADRNLDVDGQAGLDVEHVGVRQAKV
jgi:hypothetical protein